jgi:hypothetical protein
METEAEAAPVMELTAENWYAQFGKDGMVETPLGQVKMGENQFLKLANNNRGAQFGMVKPTLTNPDIVVEEYDPKEGSERDTKLLFIKTFTTNEGQKYTNFESVTVQKDGLEVSISSHIIEKNAMLHKLQTGNIAFNKFNPNGSEWRLAKNQNGLSDIVPTQESNTGEGKGTQNNLNNQEGGEKIIALAQKIAGGEQTFTLEDMQLQNNYPKELEAALNEIQQAQVDKQRIAEQEAAARNEARAAAERQRIAEQEAAAQALRENAGKLEQASLPKKLGILSEEEYIQQRRKKKD